MSPRDTARRLSDAGVRWLRPHAARRALPRAGPFWVSLALPSPLPDVPGRVASERRRTLFGVLETLEAIAEEPRVAGRAARAARCSGGIAAAQSCAARSRACARAARGSPVGGEPRPRVALRRVGGGSRVAARERARARGGLRADAFFVRDLLARGGVQPEVVRIGTHKSAGEMLTNDRMSDEQRAQLDAILGDNFAALVEGIAEGRGRTVEEVRAWIDAGRYTAAAARDAGLVDAFAYRDELDDRIGELASARADAPARPAVVGARALSVLRANARTGLRETPRIAGAVRERRDHARRVGARHRLARGERALAELAHDARVRGVVLRIDSPGGDALASDLLWRAVRALRREKPVVASLAGVAASGGYYPRERGDCVIAEPGSLTGLDRRDRWQARTLSGLFERLGVGLDAVERGARAGMHSLARGFTDERARARARRDALALRPVRRSRGGRARARCGGGRARPRRAACSRAAARSRSASSTRWADRSRRSPRCASARGCAAPSRCCRPAPARVSAARARAPAPLMSRTLKTDIPGIDWRVSLDDVREQGFAKIFAGRVARPLPLVVEIGFGRGEFLLELAQRAPEQAFVGLEVSYKRVLKMARRLAKLRVANIALLEARAEEVLRDALPSASVACFWLNFPDPWPRSATRGGASCRPSRSPRSRAVSCRRTAARGDRRSRLRGVDRRAARGRARAREPLRARPLAPAVADRTATAYELEWRALGRSFHFFEYARRAG
jgi:ClpP class serine protease